MESELLSCKGKNGYRRTRDQLGIADRLNRGYTGYLTMDIKKAKELAGGPRG